ncbi:hypothetical protein LCGC14_0786520 [marine sediment metagenome]|uniref:Uncharacterized protein n=1 Tax=marine sediment metagenome TaxID=412755 RepID=A0A0F9T115_9ZZZZ|nr:MAG: PIN domain protein [Candidatus Lokiarchaeum sp. GC14_75]
MKIVIADSNIWIGAFVSKDKWHKNGKRFLEWLYNQKNIRVIVPIGVVYEVIARILNNTDGGFEKANKAFELFMTYPDFEIYYNTEESFNEVKNVFQKYKKFSLVDSTIVILYENKGCNILFSTDSDYNACPFIYRLEFPIEF